MHGETLKHLRPSTIHKKDDGENDEEALILQHQLRLVWELVGFPDSNIIKDEAHSILLHDCLKKVDSDEGVMLLYQGSHDGISDSALHSNRDYKGSTLTIIETTEGNIFGAHENAPWGRKIMRTMMSSSFGSQTLILLAKEKHLL